ncbi:MAG TPA: glutamate dehydrogenase, partial [Deltaproteobacteria bacterium]|nr:glutamate dehydrogenase [Deltaproteobacteria bacterium]
EWVQDLQNYFWSEAEINHKLFEIMSHSFASVYQFSLQHKVGMRMA